MNEVAALFPRDGVLMQLSTMLMSTLRLINDNHTLVNECVVS